MRSDNLKPIVVFRRLGEVHVHRTSDALVILTPHGATLVLYPDSDTNVECGVHIDEIRVPEELRRQGVATAAMEALCALADSHEAAARAN